MIKTETAVKVEMREEFRSARVDLAAVLRWSARLGYQQGICNHYSFLLPGEEGLFLVNPEGRIVKVWTGVSPAHHSEEVLSALAQLSR